MGSCKRCKSLSLSLRKYLQIFSQSCSVDRTCVKNRNWKGPFYVNLKMRNENLKTIGSIGSCISCVLSPVWSTTCDSGFQTMKAATGSTSAVQWISHKTEHWPLWNWVKSTWRPVSSKNRSTRYGKFLKKERCKIIYIRQSSVPSSSASIWRNDGQHTRARPTSVVRKWSSGGSRMGVLPYILVLDQRLLPYISHIFCLGHHIYNRISTNCFHISPSSIIIQ